MNEEIKALFRKAAPDKKRHGIISLGDYQELQFIRGARYFKRKAIGLCREETIKSLEHLAKIFGELGMCGVDEAEEVIRNLEGKTITYGERTLTFEVLDREAAYDTYRIKADYTDAVKEQLKTMMELQDQTLLF